jgi:hypothetical protein
MVRWLLACNRRRRSLCVSSGQGGLLQAFDVRMVHFGQASDSKVEIVRPRSLPSGAAVVLCVWRMTRRRHCLVDG